MQRFKIIHRTYYNYSNSVDLGAHNLLLRPRENHELRIENFVLNITPKAKVLWHRDVEDNSVGIASFTESTQQLLIESELIIQQYNESPLDFLVSSYAINYPFTYEADDNLILSAYRILPDEQTRKLLNNWIFNIYKINEEIQTYTLLQRLTTYIYKNFVYKIREEVGVQSAS